MLGGASETPSRIDIALLHPEFGVALLELPPHWTPDAPGRLRRRLELARFDAIFPGHLPVAHRRLRRQDLAELPRLLDEAFAAQPPLLLPGGDAWMQAVRRALQEDPIIRPASAGRRVVEARRRPRQAGRTLLLLGGALGIGAVAAFLVLRAPLTGAPRPEAGGVAARAMVPAPAQPQERAAGPASPAGAGATAPPRLAESSMPAIPARPHEPPLPGEAELAERPAPPAPAAVEPARAASVVDIAESGTDRRPDAATGPEPPATAPAPLAAAPAADTLAAPAPPIPEPESPPPALVAIAPPALPPPVAMPEPPPARPPVAEAAPAPPAPPPAGGQASPTLLAALIRRGDALFELGDVSGARRFYERAAEAGSAEAAFAMGRTFDPRVLAASGALGIRPDPAAAAAWYRRASALRAAAGQETQNRGANR